MGLLALKYFAQTVYVHLLRAFEALFGPTCIAHYSRTAGVWANFSREVQWATKQRSYFEPRSVDEVVNIVKSAKAQGLGVRAVGSGHSFNNLTEPALGGVIINLHTHMNKVLSVEKLPVPEAGVSGAPPIVALATVQAGLRLKDACYQLSKLGYGVHNMGNYYEQTVGGVVATGTHGTTGRYRADTFSSIVAKLQLVNGLGEVVELSGGRDSVTLGALGVVTAITIKVVPMFWLRHDVVPVRDIVAATAPSNITSLLKANDFIFFRWSTVAGDSPAQYNTATMETFNAAAQEDITPITNVFNQIFTIAKYYLLTHFFNYHLPLGIKRCVVSAGKLFPSSNTDAYYLAYAVPGVVAKHIESEWALPVEATQEAVQWISANIEQLFGNNTFEIHVRFVPADDAHMSPAHGRDTVFIDVNLPRPLGYGLEPFYRKMQSLGGRPHWSKLHDLDYAAISKLYDFSSFSSLRKRHDPANTFGSAPYLAKVLGTAPAAVAAGPAANGTTR